MKRNTLDIDNYPVPVTTERIGRILAKVRGCHGNLSVRWRYSASGEGVHFELWCLRDCDTCRLVFDSPLRFCRDLGRPVWSRDVLWSRKRYWKAGCELVGEASEWNNEKA